MDGLSQANAVLTRSNTEAIAQLANITVTMNTIRAQLKTLILAPANQTRSKRNCYCWSCRSNYIHRSKTCSSKKSEHKDEAYYKKRLGGSEKECE